MTESDIYKAVSDIISDSYDWLFNENHSAVAIQYVLGVNDLARYLTEKIMEKSNSNETSKHL